MGNYVFRQGAKHLESIKSFFRPSPSSLVFDLPKKTLVLDRNPESKAFWWHTGSSGDRQAMHIVGGVTVTNICKHVTYVTAAKLKKSKTWRHGDVDDLESQCSDGYMIPNGGMTDLLFHFEDLPLVSEKGQSFKADVAIIDLFGNEHWIKGIEFPYSKRLPF